MTHSLAPTAKVLAPLAVANDRVILSAAPTAPAVAATPGASTATPMLGANGEEINVVGTFPCPFATLEDKIRAIDRSKEELYLPDSDDMDAAIRQAHGSNAPLSIGNLGRLVSLIATVDGRTRRPSGSIHRLNIFSHGNPEQVVLSGRIVPGRMLLPREDSLIDRELLKELAGRPPFPLGEIKGLVEVSQLRGVFSKGAEIYVYTCNSGLQLALLQEIANTFQVRVIGFSGAIVYCWKNSKLLRSIRLAVTPTGGDYASACASETNPPVSNFHQLKQAFRKRVVTATPARVRPSSTGAPRPSGG